MAQTVSRPMVEVGQICLCTHHTGSGDTAALIRKLGAVVRGGWFLFFLPPRKAPPPPPPLVSIEFEAERTPEEVLPRGFLYLLQKLLVHY